MTSFFSGDAQVARCIETYHVDMSMTGRNEQDKRAESKCCSHPRLPTDLERRPPEYLGLSPLPTRKALMLVRIIASGRTKSRSRRALKACSAPTARPWPPVGLARAPQ